MRPDRRPSPPPLEANDQIVTAVITGGWAVALIVVLVLRSQIPPSGRWWVWTCVAGLGMGLFGLWYVPRLKRSRARAAARRAPARAQSPSSGSNSVSSTETPGRSTKS